LELKNKWFLNKDFSLELDFEKDFDLKLAFEIEEEMDRDLN